MPPPRSERYHSLLLGRSFRYFETIEVAMGGEYPPAGSGIEVYPICVSAAWKRHSPRYWDPVIPTIFQEPLDVGQ